MWSESQVSSKCPKWIAEWNTEEKRTHRRECNKNKWHNQSEIRVQKEKTKKKDQSNSQWDKDQEFSENDERHQNRV